MPLTEVFERACPQEAGVEKTLIEDLRHSLLHHDELDLHSLLILKNGKLINEEYHSSGNREQPHILWSVSKSITSIAIGMAAGEGLLSLDESVFAVFPEFADLCDSDNKRMLNIRHLLMMGTGWTSYEGAMYHAPGNLIENCFREPVNRRPGTVFSYNSAAPCMLSAIFQRKAGMNLHDYLKERLFDPLEIEDTSWDKAPEGFDYGGWGLYMKSYDMLKIGKLLLDQGQWNGKQLIPAAYVSAATSKQIDSDATNTVPDSGWAKGECAKGYGYQFWRSSYDGFRAEGIYGQMICVYPKFDLVVVTTAESQTPALQLEMIHDCFVSKL